MLAVVGIGRDELAADRAPDLAQHGLHLGEQIVVRLAAQVLDARLVEAQAVAQFRRGGAERRVDVLVRQAVHRQSVDDPQRQRPICRAGKRLPDARLQHLAAIDHLLDVGVGAEHRVLAQRAPIGVPGDQPRAVGRKFLVDSRLHGDGERLQHLALLDRRDPLEGVDEVGMDREQPYELVQALVHVPVEPGERRQVAADLRLLVAVLLEQPFGDHVLHVGAGDEELIESDPGRAADCPPRGRSGGCRKIASCTPATKREAEVLADFAHLAQEVQVEDQLLVAAALQVVEQLVHHQQQPVIGISPLERRHQLLECPLVVRDRVRRGEPIRDVPGGERFFELRADEGPEVHRGGAQLGAGDLEPAGDRTRRVGHLPVGERVAQLAALGHRGDDRHQVRLAGAVVAHHQEALVVGRAVELKLWDQDGGQLLRHLVAHNVGGNQRVGGRFVIGVAQLHHRLDRLEPDQVAIGHSGVVRLHGTVPRETIARPACG